MIATRARVVLIGAVHDALPALEALLDDELVDVVAVLTRTIAGSRRRPGAVDLNRPAAAAGVPLLRTDNVNAPSIVNAVRGLRPDLVVVAGWDPLIGPDLLMLPPQGCVGLHASLLPRYRGYDPVTWAILRGETTTGTSLLMLDGGFDTGDVIAQAVIPIGPEDTCASVYHEVGVTGAQLLRTHLPALLTGTFERRPQRPGEGELMPARTAEMGVIDWEQPAREVHNWVRAQTAPYAGAYTVLDGQRITIWATQLPTDSEPVGPPGEIFGIERDGIRVGTAEGSILVTRMSGPGQLPGHARRWLRRSRHIVGTTFEQVSPELARWARTGGARPLGRVS